MSAYGAIVDSGRPFAANRCFAAIRRMFNWSVERSYLEVSPCYGVKAPTKEGPGRDRVLDVEELTAVLRAARETPFPFRPYVMLLLATACRRSELAQARRSEIDLENKVLLIPAERSKNGIARAVPLSSFSLSIIDQLPRFADGRLFPSGNSKATERSISGFGRMKSRLEAKCGVRLRLHDLRRSATSHLQRLGASTETIKTILGHKAVGGVTGIYARYAFSAESQTALETWGRFLTSLLESKDAKKVRAA